MSSDLIDTTEMYLKTIYELEEEGIIPLRARIAERLSQSGPTVSQTVARMERDGLVVVTGDRHLELTVKGRSLAVRVLRKHRLAELLLVEVIGLPWEDAHIEACRWEHVMSEEVERRLVGILQDPTTSPYGIPVPGLDELDVPASADDHEQLQPLTEAVGEIATRVIVRRIGEPVQNDYDLMRQLKRAGVEVGQRIKAKASAGGVLLGSVGEYVELEEREADQILVDPVVLDH